MTRLILRAIDLGASAVFMALCTKAFCVHFYKDIERELRGQIDRDNATFDRSAAAFNNPDHVDIVIHNYRWRLDLAKGEAKYDDLEKRLAAGPVITVPTITLEGDANGAPHLDPSFYVKKFSGKYEHRTINGGVGHNLPQEAPQAFERPRPALLSPERRCGPAASTSKVRFSGHGYQLSERAAAHLAHHLTAVRLDRDLADTQFEADLFVQEAPDNQGLTSRSRRLSCV